MARVFISYVRENAAVVQEIAQALKNAGFEVWTDRRLLGGADWAASIRAQIEEGTHFIACFSKEYQQRTTTYMNEELDVAITELPKTQKRSNWFIPVRLDDSDVPDRRVDEHRTLRSFTHVDLGKDWHLGIYQLVRSIDGDALMVAVDSTHLLAADSFILSGLGFPQDPFARDAFMNIVNVWCNLPHLFFAKPATVSTDLTPLLTLWHGAEAGGKLRPVSPLTPDLDRDLAARFLQWTANEEMSNAVFDWTSYQLSHERNSRIFWSGGTADVDTAATLLDSYQLISPLLNGSETFCEAAQQNRNTVDGQ